MSTSMHRRTSRARHAFRVGLVAATAIALTGAFAQTAHAALPTGPSTTGLTGSRPSATQVSFSITDRVSAQVDVATGNLLVTTNALSLVGVNNSIPVGASYNSRGWQTGSSPMGIGVDWTLNLAGAGVLTTTTNSSVVLTKADGSTWLFTPIGTTTPRQYTSPVGLKVKLEQTSDGFTLTDLTSRAKTYFNANGTPIGVADKSGNRTVITLDANDNATKVTSTAGPARVLNLGGDANGYVFTQTNGSSTRNVKYGYDSSTDHITSFTDAVGNTTSFGYNGAHLTTITSPTGATTTFTYSGTTDKIGTVTQSNTTAGSPGDSKTRFTYPSSTSTFVAGPNTDYSATVSSSPHTAYTIDPSQNLVTNAIDPNGRVRGASYNTGYSADVTSTTTGDGTSGTTVSKADYNDNNHLSLSDTTSPGGSSTAYTYDTGDNAFSPLTTDTNGGSSKNGGTSVLMHYDTAGYMDQSSTVSTDVANLHHDTTYGFVDYSIAAGNGSNKTLYAHNSNLQLSTITPVTGSSLGVKTYTYDGFGRLATASDGAGRTTTYTYDNDDRPLTTAFSDTTPTVTNTYDTAGNLLTQASASGTITNTYDQMSRLITTTNTAGGGTISYAYDRGSNLYTSTDSFGTYTNKYDDSGVLLFTKYPKSGAYDYTDFKTDIFGRRTDTWLSGTGSWTNSQSTPPSGWTAHSHTTYDNNGRISELTAYISTSSQPLMDLTYCYNTASLTTCSTNKTTDSSKLQWSQNVVSGEKTVYKYDPSGRLKSFVQSGGSNPDLNANWQFAYDARGNRTSEVGTGNHNLTVPLSYNAANQITTSGYTYDGAGNLTATPTDTYTYNAAEQMTSSTDTATGNTTTYTYAGASQNAVLSESTAGGTAYNIVYGRADQYGNPTIAQYHVGSLASEVFNDPTNGQATMLTTSTGTSTIYVYDGTGSPTWLLTDNPSAAWNQSYDPYGTERLNSASTGTGYSQNPYTFKGGIQDRASGLVKFGQRWYNPITGTWTQQDTLDSPLDPANGNRYQFAAADPINAGDPTGNSALTGAVCDAGGAGLGLADLADVASTGVGAVALAFGCLEYDLYELQQENPATRDLYATHPEEFVATAGGY